MGNLTAQDLQLLQAPFAANDHEFLQGKAYITESAITRRIEAVDPAWTLEQVSLFNRSDDSTVVCTMRLTIKGTWRDGVGMSSVVKMKSGNGEANEAEKSAATDALKRAARLFGIGRYLLDLPDNVRDANSMAKYLNAAPQPPPRAGNPTQAPTAPQTPQNAGNGLPEWTNTEVGKCWGALKAWLVSEKVYENEFELKNSFIKRGISDGKTIADAWKSKPARELIAFVKARHENDVDFMEDKAS